MPKIIPIKELKDMAKISEMCHENEGPVYVTENGDGDMVRMSIESYEEICRKEQIYKDLEIAESDILAGRTKPAGLVLKELQRKAVE